MDPEIILSPDKQYSELPKPMRIHHITNSGSCVPLPPPEEAIPGELRPLRFRITGNNCGGTSGPPPSKKHVRPDDEPIVQYGECRKNHAASKGGYALDGCGEFLASGEDGTMDALICAACSCHRNFHHRNVVCGNCKAEAHTQALSGPPTPALLTLPSSRDVFSHVGHMVMPLNTRLAYPHNHHVSPESLPRRKRARTMFTQEQKQKMLSFAERMGWKVLKQDEAVQVFCQEIGIEWQSFKAWVHNNRHNAIKKVEDNKVGLESNCTSAPSY